MSLLKEDFEMIKTDNYYASANYYENVQQQKNNSQKTNSKTSSKSEKSSETQLSYKAQALLDKLRKNYDKMDFMVADFDSVDEAQTILSRGTKEVSVLFTREEFEKMASDEKYEEEYMDRVRGALRMSEQINLEFGFNSVSENDSDNVEITRVGISFNEDGSTSYFAELEKSSANQKERIEKAREEKRSEKKEDTKKAHHDKITDMLTGKDSNIHKDSEAKRTVVYANSKDELIEKMKQINWDNIKTVNDYESGSKFNFTV